MIMMIAVLTMITVITVIMVAFQRFAERMKLRYPGPDKALGFLRPPGRERRCNTAATAMPKHQNGLHLEHRNGKL